MLDILGETQKKMTRSLRGAINSNKSVPLLRNRGEGQDSNYILEAISGGKLGYGHSVEVVRKYTARLAQSQLGSEGAMGDDIFEYKLVGQDPPMVSCSIHFPNSSPLRVFTGPPLPMEIQACTVACFEACQELHRLQLLSSSDFPPPSNHRLLLVREPIQPGQKPGQAKAYPKYRAGFWKRTIDLPPARLYPTIVSVHDPSTGAATSRPIFILARSPLPSITPFTASVAGQGRVIRTRRCAEYEVTQEQLWDIQMFTIYLCCVLMKRTVKLEGPRCVCLFAPLIPDWVDVPPPQAQDDGPEWPRLHPRQLISWEEMADIRSTQAETPVLPVGDMNGVQSLPFSPEAQVIPSLLARIDDLVAATTLNVRLFNNQIDNTILANALTAPDAQRGPGYERLELLGDTILKHLTGTYLFVFQENVAGSRSAAMTHARRQLVANGALVDLMRSCEIPAYIRCEPLPNIEGDWRPPGFRPIVFESGRKRRAAAISGKAGVDSSSGRGRANKKSKPGDTGVGGSGVVDFWESFQQFAPGKSTLKVGASRPVPGVTDEIRNSHLGLPTKHRHFLTDNTLSDVAEAILGAAYLSGGLELALKYAKTIRLPFSRLDHWSDLANHSRALDIIPEPQINMLLPRTSVEAIEDILGFKLTQPHLLTLALTHGSYTGKLYSPHDWFEFLGDSLLDYFVVTDIYNSHPEFDPGQISSLKASLANSLVLAGNLTYEMAHRHFWLLCV
ncbi:hypothetical protein FRB94_011337 [Tulasnella sp. JGI-2019a]|nr:hypothetical protein FRB93_003274 [Tulasnella sp. JGI-2019a]KAG9009891.1 hypothetical protein FRB94_011337 [Tulasnella sp. JGI-2019a]